jgi:hypothetical protein
MLCAIVVDMPSKPPSDLSVWKALAVIILITVAVLVSGWFEGWMPH